MPIARSAVVLVMLLALPAGTARAQQAQDADKPAETAANQPPAGHSLHGEVFNEGPRQRAYLMGTTGKVSMAITTKADEGQAFFNQGLGQLHGFWYFEAERSFRQAAALDPDCAMAYWGMAMANRENEKRARGFIEQAVRRKAGATPHEIRWIDALNAYLALGENNQPRDNRERRRQHIRDLEAIIHDYPDDVEAKAFLALQIWLNSSHDMPISSHQAVDALLSDVFAVEPMHPAHHYRIHLWDGEKPARALGSAALCGQSAPGIAHMWHMSGHIFSRLERYADAAWQQEASARVDHAHMIRDRVLPDQIHNYAHNNDWLIQNLSYIGRVRDAVELAKNMVELPRHPRYNTLARQNSARMGRSRLFEVLVMYELWDELITLSQTPYLEATDIQDEQVKRSRALGAAYLAKGDLEKGRAEIAYLSETLSKEKAEQQAAGEAAEAKAREEKKPDDQVAKAKADAVQGHAGRVESIERALAELHGHWALAGGDHVTALSHFEKAGLAKEALSRAYLKSGEVAKAEQLAREAVDQGTNKVYPLANLVEVLDGCGKGGEATDTFRKLQAISAHIDMQAPIFERLTAVAPRLGLPADWRLPETLGAGVGQRPDLDSLGPLRWQPAPAADWTLSDPAGKSVSLAQYHGKPVVLIFYLGFGCVHCVEQLNAFSPMTAEFAEAGIDILAISSDKPDVLSGALAARQQSAGPPLSIPIVSDADLSVFKAYRAYDDFENMPLHATFLMDAEGLVRWHDISYEPFTDTRFLLNESRRLLSTPTGGHGRP